ncbi:KLTH0C11242p [Lachancea thermotolerans CBS 6340]|uniref:KLTH0C11242p n=1 Tax=Lachancea thermotolerans (strain ATCC 56472 / CBS 6340 / NRRL Y-8284) TaxID=559295 RepID=C5DEQ5_LACTC|nr:KLTH0C11242p [Lachancea thermotolerans CBS 6340]CAR22266.1 KLTH0C11242p [Lachancea thermotolerans CBS 6340]
MPYYLPVLLNPLINAVFNCPTPQNSPLRKVFTRIEKQRFALVTPTPEILLEYEDLESGSSLQDLCYSASFVSDHILLLGGGGCSHEEEYKTLSGKTITLRNQQKALFTGEGFDARRRCQVLETELLSNFNEYFQGSSTYPIIHVDFPLTGRLARRDEWPGFKAYRFASTDTTSANSSLAASTEPKASLEQMLRAHPSYGDKLSAIIRTQRAALSSSTYNADNLAAHFMQTCEKALAAIQEDQSFRAFPNLRLQIHEYVEMNLYDDFWAQLTNSLKDSEIENQSDFSILRNISISQVPSFLYPTDRQKFDIRCVTQVEKNLREAVECLRRLPVTNSHSSKAKVIVETLQTVSRSLEINDKVISVDADTLVSLLVVVVCQAEVKDLKSHLFYLQEFAKDSNSITFGILAYGMSTLEAVLSYFESREKLKLLEKHCSSNASYWEALADGKLPLGSLNPSEVKDILRTRTPAGLSCLSICLQNRQPNLFLHLATKFEHCFPLEDLLNDETVEGSNLLIQMLDNGCSSLSGNFIEMLFRSCTKTELESFLNHVNRYQRSSGHYLMHALDLIVKVGKFINWEQRDCNGHTPLFAIIRTYDHTDYDAMVLEAYKSARLWCTLKGKQFRLSKHQDNKGNTLLHVIKSNVSVVLDDPLVNVNSFNKKGLTPIMVYARYNRLDNIKSILRDKRLIIQKCQNGSYLTCFDYIKNPVVLGELGKHAFFLPQSYQIRAHNIKFEGDEWVLWMTLVGSVPNAPAKVIQRSLKFIQSFLISFSKTNSMTFIPAESLAEELSLLAKMKIISINRLETKHFLRRASVVLSLICRQEEFEHIFNNPSGSLVNAAEHVQEQEANSTYGMIEPEEVASIQKIMKFNRTEILAIKSGALMLKKLAIFGILKGKDLERSHTMFQSHGNNFTKIIGRSTNVFGSLKHSLPQCEFGYLANNTALLELSSRLLVQKIDKILNHDIPHWWKTYGELVSLRHEYNKNFPDDVRPRVAENTGFISSYIETKRVRLEQGLVGRINRSSKNLLRFSLMLRRSNESLAVELNNFINFKAEFWVSATIKEHAAMNIKWLQEQLVCLEEALYDYKDKFASKPVNTLHIIP